MKGMTIRAMTQACHGIYHGDEGTVDIEISAITTDSRKIQKMECLLQYAVRKATDMII